MPTTRNTSRVLMLITFLAFISIGFPDAVLGVAWPLMRETFDRSLSSLGYILVFSGTGYFLSSAFAGRAIDRLGVGRLLAISTSLAAIGLFGYALSPTFWMLPFAALVIGLGSGAIDAGLNFYASEHFSVTIMNWLHAFFGIGAMIGPFIMAGVFAAGGGWRTGYFVVASLIALMALVFIFTANLWNDGERHDADNPPARVPLGQVMRMPAVWLHILMFLFMAGIEATAGNWTATIMVGKFGASESSAGLWAGVFWGAMAVGRIVMVPLSRDMNPARLVQLCTWGVLAGAILMTLDQVRVFQLGLIVFGLGMAPLFPTMMSLTPMRFGSQVAMHTIGFQVSAATLGIIGISSISGIVADATTLTAIPVIMVGGAIITVVLDILIRRRTDHIVGNSAST